MNRYQLCAKYGWAFSSNMPDRYIERKGIIFDKIAEKGDIDQVTELQRENRQLTEKVEALEVVDSTFRGEYKRVRKALEFVMELVEDVEEEELKGHLLKKRREQLMAKQSQIF
jgi:CRISPR/Cas system-associated protein Cas5 (RAMP superfamily)